MGDGGLQMNIQELGTIMEQKAPVKIICLNNNYLGNVRQWQAMFFNRRYSFTPMLNPDYMKIASAYDIPSKRVFSREELKAAIDENALDRRAVPARSLCGRRRQCPPDDPSGRFSQSDVAGMLILNLESYE